MPQIMVWINNPQDYPSWNSDLKYERAKATIQWHKYIRKLFKDKKVTHIWGSHQLLSRATSSPSHGLLIAIYSTETWDEFDDLIASDPLRRLIGHP